MSEGTITGLSWQRGSGLATLHVRDDDGAVHSLHADAGPLLRALASAYGSAEAAEGQRIAYEMTDFGTMAGFNPLEDS